MFKGYQLLSKTAMLNTDDVKEVLWEAGTDRKFKPMRPMAELKQGGASCCIYLQLGAARADTA